MNLSIVIPLYNEEESLPELIALIEEVVNSMAISYEVILVDDGSRDNSWGVVEMLSKKNSTIKGVQFRRNYGKSAALYSGFAKAQGEVVITMDADLQDNPSEIPELYRMIKEEGFDLVSGWKKQRFDPLSKTIPTKLYNASVRALSGIKLHDFNCGLKAYKRDVIKSIEVYGEMHRYIPYMAKKAGFTKIGEKVVIHQKRKYGVTKFGMERFINGPLDLLSIMFISMFGKRPMHFFGSLGLLMFLVGFLASSAMGAHKLYMVYNNLRAPLITTNPLFYVALVAMILGTQLFLAGFLGELISRNSTDRNRYDISNEI